jgi:hypothetical protein
LVSTTQKAEEIRRKIAFLTYALQKAKKDHSDVLLQLRSVVREKKDLQSFAHGDDSYEVLLQQKRELEDKLEAMELSLKDARESEERHKKEAELSEKKYQESQQAAGYFKEQVHNLRSMLQDAKAEHTCLKQQLEQVNVKVSDLIKNAEQRGKSAALKELKKYQEEVGDVEELMELYNRLNDENKTLHRRLEETEDALAAARDMKRFESVAYEGSLDVEDLASVVRHQIIASNDSADHVDAKESMTQKLKERMNRIVNESKKSQTEIRNLAVAMENRATPFTGGENISQTHELSKAGLFVGNFAEQANRRDDDDDDDSETEIVFAATTSTYSVSAGNSNDEIRDGIIAGSSSAESNDSIDDESVEDADDDDDSKPSLWWHLAGKRNRSRSNSPPASNCDTIAGSQSNNNNGTPRKVPKVESDITDLLNEAAPSQTESKVDDDDNEDDIQSTNSGSIISSNINDSGRQEHYRGIEDDDGETRDPSTEERE